MPVLSAKEVTSPNDLKGKQRPQPGKYHVFITHWDETCKEKDQLGRRLYRDRRYYPGPNRPRVANVDAVPRQGRQRPDRPHHAIGDVHRLLRTRQEIDEDLTSKALGGNS